MAVAAVAFAAAAAAAAATSLGRLVPPFLSLQNERQVVWKNYGSGDGCARWYCRCFCRLRQCFRRYYCGIDHYSHSNAAVGSGAGSGAGAGGEREGKKSCKRPKNSERGPPRTQKWSSRP